MTYFGLAACLSLMLFGLVSLVGSLVVGPVLRRRIGAAEPGAGALLTLRLAPTLAAAFLAGAVFLPAFLRLEPRHSGERLGAVTLAMGAAVALMLASGPIRVLRTVLATRALERRWRSGATGIALPGLDLPAFAVDERFPLVGVVGVLRPRLYVARQVLERCTAGELRAIAAHEASHVLRHDNLARLLLRGCPDALAFTRTGVAFERAWSEACDRVADDHAARTGSRLDLAAALVKVARALGTSAPAAGNVAAFCREETIGTRVRRLLRPADAGAHAGAAHRRLALAAMPLMAAFVAAQADPVAVRIHGLAESVVRFLQ
jgi:Zn-dependent protease with chaperone function